MGNKNVCYKTSDSMSNEQKTVILCKRYFPLIGIKEQ